MVQITKSSVSNIGDVVIAAKLIRRRTIISGVFGHVRPQCGSDGFDPKMLPLGCFALDKVGRPWVMTREAALVRQYDPPEYAIEWTLDVSQSHGLFMLINDNRTTANAILVCHRARGLPIYAWISMTDIQKGDRICGQFPPKLPRPQILPYFATGGVPSKRKPLCSSNV